MCISELIFCRYGRLFMSKFCRWEIIIFVWYKSCYTATVMLRFTRITHVWDLMMCLFHICYCQRDYFKFKFNCTPQNKCHMPTWLFLTSTFGAGSSRHTHTRTHTHTRACIHTHTPHTDAHTAPHHTPHTHTHLHTAHFSNSRKSVANTAS